MGERDVYDDDDDDTVYKGNRGNKQCKRVLMRNGHGRSF